MRKLLQLSLIIPFLLIGCKKSNVKPAPVVLPTVTINGADYSYVKIGNLYWTTVNYNGPGGVNYDDSTVNLPAYGKYYTFAEATSITLPTGWRLPTFADFENLMNTVGKVDTGVASFHEYPLDSVYSVKLRSTTGWGQFNGTNTSGFNALPAGFYYYQGVIPNSPTWYQKGSSASFWSSTPGPPAVVPTAPAGYSPYTFGFNSFTSPAKVPGLATILGVSVYYTVDTYYRSSIRFVKDE